MQDLVAGFDSGTQSVKTIIFDENGGIAGLGRAAHKVSTPRPKWAEQDPRDWWKAFCTSMKMALRSSKVSLKKIVAIGLTHQRSTLCIVDKNCNAILPAQVWYDSRAVKQVQWIKNEFGSERYMRIAGRIPDTAWFSSKLLWVKDNEPEAFKEAYKFLTVHGYFIRKLTGGWKDTYAAPTGLLDEANYRYSDEILDAFEIPKEKLCELTPPGEVIGYISTEAARETGLPEGLPVASGAGDQQAGGLGCGVVNPGMAYLNLGTSVVLGLISSKYIYHQNFFVREGVLPETWNLEAIIDGGYWMITWFKENFAKEEIRKAKRLNVSTEDILDREASRISAGSDGLIVQPYWLGVHQPYWDEYAKGSAIGWMGGHKMAHFYRAIIEGIAYDMRLNLDGLEEATGIEIDDIRVFGGGAQSRLSCQTIADVFNKNISTVSTPEATALGAAILAAASVRLYPDIKQASLNMTKIKSKFTPIKSNSEVYNKLYDRIYRNYYDSVKPLFREVADIVGY